MGFKIGEKVKLHDSFDYNNKIGEITNIDENYPYNGKTIQRLLIKGKGLGGAIITDKEGKRNVADDARYAYDFMVERVK